MGGGKWKDEKDMGHQASTWKVLDARKGHNAYVMHIIYLQIGVIS